MIPVSDSPPYSPSPLSESEEENKKDIRFQGNREKADNAEVTLIPDGDLHHTTTLYIFKSMSNSNQINDGQWDACSHYNG